MNRTLLKLWTAKAVLIKLSVKRNMYFDPKCSDCYWWGTCYKQLQWFLLSTDPGVGWHPSQESSSHWSSRSEQLQHDFIIESQYAMSGAGIANPIQHQLTSNTGDYECITVISLSHQYWQCLHKWNQNQTCSSSARPSDAETVVVAEGDV